MKELDILGVTLIHFENLFHLVIRLCLDLFFVTILIRKIYLKINRNRDYLFIFYLFNILIFFVASLLRNVELETGFAFGLFAIFSIIRYRTSQIPIKEMTFLFATIIMATINSTVTIKLSYAEIILANLAILTVSFIMERDWLRNLKPRKTITYEKIELIVPSRRSELITDLEARTGLKILSIQIKSVNFLRDTAKIRIFYHESTKSGAQSTP